MSSLRGNLWKIYSYKFLGEFWLIVPVLIAFYEESGLSASQIFTVQAVFHVAVLTLEIPSGYLADVVGRRRTLIIGAAFLPLGLLVYVSLRSFAGFIFAEFLVALAMSMRSGCDSALIYDTLIQLKSEQDYTRYEGRSFFYARVGTSLSALLGGLLATITLSTPFYVNMMVAALMLPVAVGLIEPRRAKPVVQNPLLDILRITRDSLRDRRLRPLIGMTALTMSTGVTGVWAYFLYYEQLGISIGWFGVIFAVFQLASAFASRYAQAIITGLGARRALVLLLATGPFFMLLGIWQSPLLITVILLNAAIWGYSFPLLLNHMNRLIASDIRATVLSVANMTASVAFAILGPLFGFLVDRFSLAKAFLALGVLVMIAGTWALRGIFRHTLAAETEAGEKLVGGENE